jgi:SAM-dependent methyltransferase
MFEDNYIKSRFTFDKRRNYIWLNIEQYIERIIPKTGSILEIGAGYCDWINNCDASHRVAYDINSDFKDFAKPDVEFIQGTCTELQPKFVNKFERIQLSNIIEHLFYDEINKTIDNLRMYLKHGGFIVIIQPNYFYSYRSYFDDFTHRTIWTHVSLKDLFESKGFTSVHI